MLPKKKRTFFISFLLLALLILVACGPAALPTPTIVPLEESGAETAGQPQQAAATATSTSTPLPQPSPTPTSTPFPATIATTATVTSTVTLTASTVSTSTIQVEILAGALNVRQGPGINYPAIATVLQGEVLPVIGVDPSKYWLQINLTDGRLGWIASQPPYAQLLNSTVAEIPVVSGTAPAPAATAPASGAVVPSSNPSGSRLAFMTGSGGDLYVINTDGTGLRLLASGVIDPAVSRDGQQVAFTRWDGAEIGTLYTINLDGSNERAVVGDILQPKSPVWSPDGQQIVISFQHGGLRDPNRECRTFEPGEQIRIPDNATILWAGARPDGSLRICFIRKEDLQWRLRRVDVATGAFEDLPSDDYAYNPTWDPNSTWRVIYGGKTGLIQMDVTNGSQWPVTTDIRDKDPVFSPDGRKLAITYKQHDHWEVYTYDLETGARQRLTKPPILADPQYNSAAPTWSPDGSQIAFLTDRTGKWEIWVMNADGTGQQPMFSPEIQAQLNLNYFGVNERVLNWVK